MQPALPTMGSTMTAAIDPVWREGCSIAAMS